MFMGGKYGKTSSTLDENDLVSTPLELFSHDCSHLFAGDYLPF